MTYAQCLNHVHDLLRAARHTTIADERVAIFATAREVLAEARATTRTDLTHASPEIAALAKVAQTELDALEQSIDALASMPASFPKKQS